jgi:hypothetical protein
VVLKLLESGVLNFGKFPVIPFLSNKKKEKKGNIREEEKATDFK